MKKCSLTWNYNYFKIHQCILSLNVEAGLPPTKLCKYLNQTGTWVLPRQSITKSWSLLKLMSIVPVMPSNHHILCRLLLLLPSIFPGIRVFSNESVLWIRWPKYWSFSFNISPSNEYSGLISFRMDWLHLLPVQGTLRSLLQQFESINSLAFSFLYGPTLLSVDDYWKNHSFD